MPAPRDAARAADRYDLIIVGGGIHGIMAALEAARRGLRPLVLERGRCGAATTANSLRIIHGGLRYLQHLDLGRHRESVRERRWWLRHFPDLVEPLACLMPLYGAGLHRPWVLRPVLALNDLLAFDRNSGVRLERQLPAGRMVGPDEVRRRFPAVDARGLRGGALWYDAFAADVARLVHEALRWARAEGADALEQVAAVDLLRQGRQVAGVRARADGAELELRAGVVINAAGPWCAGLAAAWDRARARLYPPSLAWNVLFRRPALAEGALAVRPRRPGGQLYFLVPWQGLLLAGTGHAPWRDGLDAPRPGPEHVQRLIGDLNDAVPGLDLDPAEVEQVFAGLLPVTAPGSGELARRGHVIDHGADGGPVGLFTFSGIKLTTARAAAERVIRRAFPQARPRPEQAFRRAPPGPAARGAGQETMTGKPDEVLRT